jgi:hypothetical protein
LNTNFFEFVRSCLWLHKYNGDVGTLRGLLKLVFLHQVTSNKILRTKTFENNNKFQIGYAIKYLLLISFKYIFNICLTSMLGVSFILLYIISCMISIQIVFQFFIKVIYIYHVLDFDYNCKYTMILILYIEWL